MQLSEEQIGIPRQAPEPRRKLSKPPLELFNEVVSGAPATRLKSLAEFVGEDILQEYVDIGHDAQIRAIQLDDDPEPEFIAIFHFQFQTRVIVADSTPEGWNIVGQFKYWYHWNADEAEKIVEVHPPFILIRESNGGTGIFEMTVHVYRLWKGRLYKTLELEESSDITMWGDPDHTRTITKRDIQFETGDFSLWTTKPLDERHPLPWLRVNTEERTTFNGSDAGKSHPVLSCDGYEWIPESFEFKITKKATETVCK